MIMSVDEFRFKQAEFCVFLGAFCAELEHLAHCGVTIDVGVTTLNVGIFFGVSLGDGAVNLHEFGFSVADAAALSAILDIGLSGALEAGLHQDFLDDVLELFDRWDTSLNFLLGDADDLVGDVCGTIVTEFTGCSASLGDRFRDFFLFKRGDLTVALAN